MNERLQSNNWVATSSSTELLGAVRSENLSIGAGISPERPMSDGYGEQMVDGPTQQYGQVPQDPQDRNIERDNRTISGDYMTNGIYTPSKSGVMIIIDTLEYGYVLSVGGVRHALATVDEVFLRLSEVLGTDNMKAKQPNDSTKSIDIDVLNHGYSVRVGCQRFASENKDKMILKLTEYLRAPYETEQKWFAGKLGL